ncbi:MAG TPA: hypothetical protein VF216_10625 [Mizugakiibacter sp.]
MKRCGFLYFSHFFPLISRLWRVGAACGMLRLRAGALRRGPRKEESGMRSHVFAHLPAAAAPA